MNDDRLREAFHQLRRRESARAPRFERSRQPRPRARRRPLAAVSFGVLLLIIMGVVLHRTPQVTQPRIASWRAPTDFLLRTPGHELLHNVPDLKGNVQ